MTFEYCRLRVRSRDKEKFFRLIVPFIHKSMRYKLPNPNDPNFGYETLGTAGASDIRNYIRGSVFTITEAGTADSIVAGMKITSGSYTGKMRCAIYLHSDLSLVANGVTAESTITLTTTATFYTFNFTGTKPSLTAATAYILVVWAAGSAAGVARLCYNAGDADQGHYQGMLYGISNPFPNPLVPTHDNNQYSIYCTYTLAKPLVTHVRIR